MPGQVMPGPGGSGPGSFLVNGSASQADAQGAVTWSSPPDNVLIVGATNNSSGFSWVDLHYARTVPASGSLPLGFTYSNGFTSGDAAAGAGAAETAFRPSVSIASPGNGSVTHSPSAVVSGNAGDARQLTSLTVNGVAQSVSGGAWSTTVALAPGANTITAVATNLFGNTSQAQTTVTYVPPVPPPALSNVSQSHRVWRESGRPGKRKPPIGTMFTLTVSQTARISFRFQQPAAGRRFRRRCVAPTRRNSNRRPCQRTVPAGSLAFNATRGRVQVKFYGVMARGHALRPGTYTLLITATDPSTGSSSTTHRLTFTIVR
jgi:hypothetical protein